MSSRHLAFLLLLLPHVGCTLLQPQPPAPPPEAKGEKELPPEQAAQLHLETARELEKVGREPEAIAQYELARQSDARLTQVSRRLAVLYDRQCETTKALAEYRLALHLTPKDADLLNDLGYCHYSRGDMAAAEKTLREALAIDGKHARAWTNLGLALGRQERYAESFEAFSHAVTPAEAHANVGVLMAQQGKTDEARQRLRQALELAPEMRTAQAVLSRLQSDAPLVSDASQKR